MKIWCKFVITPTNFAKTDTNTHRQPENIIPPAPLPRNYCGLIWKAFVKPSCDIFFKKSSSDLVHSSYGHKRRASRWDWYRFGQRRSVTMAVSSLWDRICCGHICEGWCADCWEHSRRLCVRKVAIFIRLPATVVLLTGTVVQLHATVVLLSVTVVQLKTNWDRKVCRRSWLNYLQTHNHLRLSGMPFFKGLVEITCFCNKTVLKHNVIKSESLKIPVANPWKILISGLQSYTRLGSLFNCLRQPVKCMRLYDFMRFWDDCMKLS